jgi:hypothetical protein
MIKIKNQQAVMVNSIAISSIFASKVGSPGDLSPEDFKVVKQAKPVAKIKKQGS